MEVSGIFWNTFFLYLVAGTEPLCKPRSGLEGQQVSQEIMLVLQVPLDWLGSRWDMAAAQLVGSIRALLGTRQAEGPRPLTPVSSLGLGRLLWLGAPWLSSTWL